MALNVFKQGAEGRLYIDEYNNKPCIIKERFIKIYRHPDLDKQVTKQRMSAETKASTRCNTIGIKVPTIYHSDINSRKIYMEYFDKAITLKEFINSELPKHSKEVSNKIINHICNEIGTIIGKMHSNNIIHGDLTTSNILINPVNNSFDLYEIIMIDFGLSSYSNNVEEKAVDLYVLERALHSTHSELPLLFSNTLDAYKMEIKNDQDAILNRFEAVRARGRKRTMVG